MSLIIASPTNGQVESLTRNQIFKRFLRETQLGTYGTATGGSTSTIVDTTRLKSTQYTDDEWVGGWARISKDAGGAAAAPEGEISPVTTYAPSSGTVTFNPVMSAVVASGDEYELWKYPDPVVIKDLLDQVLKQDIYLPYWSVLSEVPDFDMEQNHTTDWTASNATVTKVTAEPVMNGRRWLSVATTSANGNARSALLRVEPGKRYYISALCRSNVASTTCKLIAYDETNSAEIDSATSTRLFNNRLYFEITVPSTCYTISVRLSNVENSVTSYWDDVIVYALDSTEIALPWWVKNKDQIKGIFKLSANPLAADVLDGALIGDIVNHKYDIQDSAFGRGQLKLTCKSGIDGPLFIFGIRSEEAFTNDNTDIKRIDENLLINCLAYRVFGMMRQTPNVSPLDADWIREQYKDYEKLYKQSMRTQSESVERVIQSVIPDSYYSSPLQRWD